MALILSLETSTNLCSVALSRDGETFAVREESSEKYIHSEKLHLFIDGLMQEYKLPYADLDAVAVGKGPGSYTGLRIGVSAAKGFAFALDIPLISVNGLRNLTYQLIKTEKIGTDDMLIPMLDARRMEVYCACFSFAGKQLKPVEAKIIDASSFEDLEVEPIHLFGDGAEKCKPVLTDSRFIFHDLKYPNARALGALAFAEFQEKAFEDIAYFEPFYLKDFVAGKPRKLL